MPKRQTLATVKRMALSPERLSKSSLSWQTDFSGAISRRMRRALSCCPVAERMRGIREFEPSCSQTSWIQQHSLNRWVTRQL
jgi:hypothetical protein